MMRANRTSWKGWMVGLVLLWVGWGGHGQPSSANPESATESSPAGLLQEQPAPPSSAKPESAKPLPPEIIQTWQEAGARVGWMALIGGRLRFASTKEEVLEYLPDFLKPQVVFVPAFRLERWQEGQIATLAPPPLPFGLDLSGTGITDADLKELAALKNLQGLHLSDTQITDVGLKELAGLKLKSLSIPDQARTDLGLKHYLAVVEAPTNLNLSDWKITDAGLKELAALKNLQGLTLSVTQITDAGLKELAALKNLQWLVLSGTQITDVGLKELAALKNLQVLTLSFTQITDAGLKELRQALPNCEIVK